MTSCFKARDLEEKVEPLLEWRCGPWSKKVYTKVTWVPEAIVKTTCWRLQSTKRPYERLNSLSCILEGAYVTSAATFILINRNGSAWAQGEAWNITESVTLDVENNPTAAEECGPISWAGPSGHGGRALVDSTERVSSGSSSKWVCVDKCVPRRWNIVDKRFSTSSCH